MRRPLTSRHHDGVLEEMCDVRTLFLDVEAVDRHVLDNSSAHAQVNPLCQRIVFAERLQDLQVAN